MPPALNTLEMWAKHPSHPYGATPGHTSTLTPYKEQAHFSGMGLARESVTYFCSLLQLAQESQ